MRGTVMLTVRRFAGAFVAVSVGIALLTAATLLFASGRAQVPDRLADAAVVVRGHPARSPADPFPPTVPWSSDAATDLAGRLATIPGVAAAVPDRTFYVQAVIDGRPYPADARRQDAREGHGWSSARLGGLRLAAGAAPVSPGQVVVARGLGLSPGDAVTLLTAAGPAAYTVSGTIDAPGFHVTDEVAEALAPGVSTIGLVLRPGTDPATVATAARTVTGTAGRVLTGDDRSVLEPRDDARTRWIGMQVLTAVAALSGFVTVFVVASTFAFVVAQRRREFGLLRAVGATPRQIRRTVQGEALAVGAAGSILGLLVGAACATPLGWALVDAGFEPATFRVRFVLWPVVVALLAGPVVALAGAWAAARRAARVRPVEALREAAVEQRPMGRARWVTGLLLVAAGAAFAVGTATSGSAQDSATFVLYSAMALVTGCTVLAPAVVGPVVRLLRWPLPSRGGAIGMLVRGSALTAARRTASTAAPVLLTVAFAVLVSGMVRTSTGAYAAGRSARIDAGWVVAPDGTPGLSDTAAAAVPGASVLPTTVFALAGSPGSVPGVAPSDGSAGAPATGSAKPSAAASAGGSAAASAGGSANAQAGGSANASAAGSASGPTAGLESGPAGGSTGGRAGGSASASAVGSGSGPAGASTGGRASGSATALASGSASAPTGGSAGAFTGGAANSSTGSAASGSVNGSADGLRARVALGVDADAFAAVNRRLEVVSGAVADLRGDDTVVLTVSEAAAAGGVAGSATGGVGQVGPAVYPVVFADGTVVRLRVVAVITDASIPGDLVLPRTVVRAHDPSALTWAVFVRDRVEVPAGSGARVVDVDAWAAEQDSAEDRLVWLFTVLLIAVSAGYGAIAVANTLLMAAAGRAADLRAVRLAGATRRQVLRLVTAESALVVLIGAALGGGVALVALLSIRAGLSEQVGAPVALVVPWPVVGGVIGLCLVLAVAATAVPTSRMLRSGPVHEPG